MWRRSFIRRLRFAFARARGASSFVCVLTLMIALPAAASEPTKACHVALSARINQGLSFHPTEMMYRKASMVGNNVYLTLFDRDAQSRLAPLLAKSWQIDRTRKRIRIELNRSCRWSDGQPITAEQMVAGIRMLYAYPSRKLLWRDYIEGGAEVVRGEREASALALEVLSPHSVEIGYAHSAQLLLLALSSPTFTPIAAEWRNTQSAHKFDGLPKVSSGAYRVREHSEEKLVLEQNPYFCQGLASNIQQATVYTRIPARADVGALLSRRVDALLEAPFRSVHSLDQRTDSKGVKIAYHATLDEAQGTYLLLNGQRPALADARLRKAIRLLIDHELMLSQSIFGGQEGQLMNSFAQPYAHYHPPRYPRDSRPYSARLAEARSLAQAAGVSAERPLTLDIPALNQGVFYSANQALKGMLKGIHIHTQFRFYDNINDYYRNHRGGSYDLAFMAWSDVLPDPSDTLAVIIRQRNLPPELKRQLKSQLQDSLSLPSEPERMQAMADIARALGQQDALIPLYTISKNMAFNAERLEFQGSRLGSLKSMRHKLCERAPRQADSSLAYRPH